MEWKKLSHNEVLEMDDFYISYNPRAGGEFNFLQSDNHQPETALVIPNNEHKFRILNGDFRKEYEKLVGEGKEACIKFYDKLKKEHISTWSSDYFDLKEDGVVNWFEARAENIKK